MTLRLTKKQYDEIVNRKEPPSGRKGVWSVFIPVATVSEANRRDHWAVKHLRHKQQRQLAKTLTTVKIRSDSVLYALLCAIVLAGKFTIRMTRYGGRWIDPGDNLNGSMKSVRDGVCDALEIKDKSPDIAWDYQQNKAKPVGVLVEIF